MQLNVVGETHKHPDWLCFKFMIMETSLVVQSLRLCLPMQGVQVQSLVGKLRSHMPCGQKAKKHKRYTSKKKNCDHEPQADSFMSGSCFFTFLLHLLSQSPTSLFCSNFTLFKILTLPSLSLLSAHALASYFTVKIAAVR